MASAPTLVNLLSVVAGYGPPWCIDGQTSTPVGNPLKISRPAFSTIVTKDDQPLLFTLSETASISVYDATTYEHKGDVGDLGISPYVLNVVGE